MGESAIVTSNRAGRGSRAGLGFGIVGAPSRCGVQWVRARLRRAVSAATVSAAMWSSACAGSVITVMRSHSTDSGAIPIDEVDRRDAELGEPPDPLDAGSGVGPAAVGEDVDEPWAAWVGHLEPV